MASARLLKSLIVPVMQRHPNVIFFDNMLFFQPIGWYLRGCIFGRSSWMGAAKFAFVNRFVMPLCEPRIRGEGGWCGRLRTRAGSEAWYVEDNFTQEFEWALETEIAAHVEAISTGEDFKLYIEKNLDNLSWRKQARAVGCLHMGQLAEAKELLEGVIKKYKARSPGDGEEASSIANARMIIHGIETDPLGLEAKLIATAVQTAENFRITKFWTKPEKFWDQPPQLP